MSPTKVSHFDRGVWRSLIWVDITVSKVTKSKGDGSSFLKLVIDIITIFRSYVLLQNWMIPQWQNCPSLVIVGPQVCLLIEWFEHGQILYIALLDLSFLHNLPPMKEFGSIHFTTTATPHFGHLSVSALSPFVTPPRSTMSSLLTMPRMGLPWAAIACRRLSSLMTRRRVLRLIGLEDPLELDQFRGNWMNFRAHWEAQPWLKFF